MLERYGEPPTPVSVVLIICEGERTESALISPFARTSPALTPAKRGGNRHVWGMLAALAACCGVDEPCDELMEATEDAAHEVCEVTETEARSVDDAVASARERRARLRRFARALVFQALDAALECVRTRCVFGRKSRGMN